MKRIAIISILCVGLGGCGAKAGLQDITVSGSTFCEIAQKKSWSIEDTQPTIDGIRRDNAKIDRLCGKSKAQATS